MILLILTTFSYDIYFASFHSPTPSPSLSLNVFLQIAGKIATIRTCKNFVPHFSLIPSLCFAFLEDNSKSTGISKSDGTDNQELPWKWKGTLLHFESPSIQPSNKIASFDFDGTLAKTSLFKHGADAWSVLYPTCVQKLTKLYKAGYKLVIFTNQAAIGKAKATKEKVIAEKKGRLAGFVNKVGLRHANGMKHITFQGFKMILVLMSN